MENSILDSAIDLLTTQMIEHYFKSKKLEEEKFIMTKKDLYVFCIKLIKEIKKYEEK